MKTATTPDKMVHRTIVLPGNRRQHISVACDFLGISGEAFIQEAIIKHLQATYELMTADLAA